MTDTQPLIDFSGINAQFVEEPTPVEHEQVDEWEQFPRADFPEEPDLEFTRANTDSGEQFVKPERRRPHAAKYERKVSGILKAGFQATIGHKNTLPDAAAIAINAPAVARAMGDLAAEDANVARAIDWITEGTENPYLSAAFVTAPLVLQIIRNHEPVLEPKQRGFKIPFGKRKGQRWQFPLKLGIKLRGLRNMTEEPSELADTFFSKPGVLEALAKQGWIIADNDAEG